ncbi:transmembrane protein 170A isoform X2 [Xiphias gladius]|uniref:transmembrane protein 170A isoform X2 n=1 Tax=Xiphias gladius TaxID=8245 RepID=UPI001A999260|nr:transmembrane protein 170A isoform X2 [Xiphias gladius]
MSCLGLKGRSLGLGLVVGLPILVVPPRTSRFSMRVEVYWRDGHQSPKSCYLIWCFDDGVGGRRLTQMWYGVFLWAAVSSLVFHLPAALLSLATLRQHKMARFMPIAILLMGIVGPVFGGVLTSAAIADLVIQWRIEALH